MSKIGGRPAKINVHVGIPAHVGGVRTPHYADEIRVWPVNHSIRACAINSYSTNTRRTSTGRCGGRCKRRCRLLLYVRQQQYVGRACTTMTDVARILTTTLLRCRCWFGNSYTLRKLIRQKHKVANAGITTTIRCQYLPTVALRCLSLCYIVLYACDGYHFNVDLLLLTRHMTNGLMRSVVLFQVMMPTSCTWLFVLVAI